VTVDGTSILLFWYRNQIYAISSRSPAEGAYSEGFIKAKFTQEYGIICPSTGSVFSLKDGSILDWYPTNPVLRSITPKTGSLTVRGSPLMLGAHPFMQCHHDVSIE
jgi:nitrite reductase/ring-hydroxylating ferredoxin subunit